MKRPITGYHRDEQGDWVAELSCGHGQHVRHKPPFTLRPWVETAAGRDSMLGTELDCVRCDRGEPVGGG
jgi:tellurite methyltransferase